MKLMRNILIFSIILVYILILINIFCLFYYKYYEFNFNMQIKREITFNKNNQGWYFIDEQSKNELIELYKNVNGAEELCLLIDSLKVEKYSYILSFEKEIFKIEYSPAKFIDSNFLIRVYMEADSFNNDGYYAIYKINNRNIKIDKNDKYSVLYVEYDNYEITME